MTSHLTSNYRALNASRNDLARGGRNVADIQELLLHFLQPFRRLHRFRNSFQCQRVLRSDWRYTQGYNKYCLCPGKLAQGFGSLLHQFDHLARSRTVPISIAGIWQRCLVSNLLDWCKDSSRYKSPFWYLTFSFHKAYTSQTTQNSCNRQYSAMASTFLKASSSSLSASSTASYQVLGSYYSSACYTSSLAASSTNTNSSMPWTTADTLQAKLGQSSATVLSSA